MSRRGRILSVNIGRIRMIERDGERVPTGIYKEPAAGRRELAGDRVEGDSIGNPRSHGGYDKAVYAYAAEDYEWWAERLGRDLGPGSFGENLTTEGIDVSGAVIGERWRAGEALLEVSEPRQPCAKLAAKMGEPGFVREFLAELRLGSYLRIAEPGSVGAGDEIEVVSRPRHGISVRNLGELLLGDRSRAAAIADLSEATAEWRERAAAGR